MLLMFMCGEVVLTMIGMVYTAFLFKLLNRSIIIINIHTKQFVWLSLAVWACKDIIMYISY